LAELRSIQDFYVSYLLQGVEGVSEVASIGGFVKEYQIDVDPNKLFAFNVHFNKLISSIQNSNIDVGAEVIEDGDREFIVRGKGFFKSLSDIENVVVGIRNKTPIRIKDVATVGVGPGFRRGALDKNGTESVGGVVTMRFGENPKEIIDNVKKRLSIVKKGLPKGVSLVPFYDRTEVIERTIGTVYKALTEEMPQEERNTPGINLARQSQ
jgi:Cu(I)/Ag(I) efflux system membrane protein CusA/SilA